MNDELVRVHDHCLRQEAPDIFHIQTHTYINQRSRFELQIQSRANTFWINPLLLNIRHVACIIQEIKQQNNEI